MQLSAYLLLLDNPKEVIELFTSKHGRCLIENALDELVILQDYCKNINNVIKKSLNNEEVFDIAYSYHCYKKTGKCEKHIYASPSSQFDRFGNPSENYNGDYTFIARSEVFGQKAIYQSSIALKNGETVAFPVEAEFNSFAIDWIKNSKTLFNVSVATALGFDNDGNFGYYSKADLKTLKPVTIRLLRSLLDYASAPSSVDINVNRVSYLIKSITEIIGLPIKSKMVFNTTYNNLNKMKSDDPTGIKKSQYLRLKYEQIMSNLGNEQILSSQAVKIKEDCKVIFSARTNNTDSKNIGNDIMGFVHRAVPESTRVDYVDRFLSSLRNSMPVEIFNNAANSTVSAVKLFCKVNMLNNYIVNLKLELEPEISDKELSEASDELYKVFGIPFMSKAPIQDLLMELSNNYIITEEEYRLNKPTEALINFAHMMSYSLDSKIFRQSIDSMRN